MAKSYRIQFNIAFLFLFLFLSLAVNYFHTEDTLKRCCKCPACHFQNSTLTTAQINFFHLPQLATLETLRLIESIFLSHLFFVTPSSRSPPGL